MIESALRAFEFLSEKFLVCLVFGFPLAIVITNLIRKVD